jgi:SOS-response transcriptional repressor LexA
MFISASRVRGPTESADESSVWRMSEKSFTDRQGQYLAFIDAYTRVHGRPPAETDMQRHFQVSPPSVHQMILTLERAGLIRRQPGVARSIEVLVAPEYLPRLRHPQPVKSSGPRI